MIAYYLQPPEARAIFLHNNFLRNRTCSVSGGRGGAQRTVRGGGINGDDPEFIRNLQALIIYNHPVSTRVARNYTKSYMAKHWNMNRD